MISKHKNNISIIEIGTGTGRIIFDLYKDLKNDNIKFTGFDLSRAMKTNADRQKNAAEIKQGKIEFVVKDASDSDMLNQFNDDTVKVVLCLFNTIGVIHGEDKRKKVIENMKKIAGDNGVVIISAFNGDNFKQIAPHIYKPIEDLVGQIDENLSFDNDRKVFRTESGYHSEWLTKSTCEDYLKNEKEIGETRNIEVQLEGEKNAIDFGFVYTNKSI